MSAHAKDFAHAIAEAYATTSASIELGAGVCDGTVEPEAAVRIPLAMMNRHGLIAGATGTGKTRTLQLLAEQLSAAGVPTFVADMKGDLSGLAVAGSPNSPAAKRNAQLQVDVKQQGFPVEYLALGGIGAGVPVRATVSDFGPQLLAKVLGANETQEQSLGLVFRYADEKGLPLLDLSDLRALLTFLSSKEGKAELTGIGGLASQTLGVLLRALVILEDEGGNERQFAIADLLRTAADGCGIISCLELPAVQEKPKLFSMAMMWLLAELFEQLPEVGDVEKPKLVSLFDEAHLLFADATKALLESVERTVRLIRSKGVGVFFVTHMPTDVPAAVLARLGTGSSTRSVPSPRGREGAQAHRLDVSEVGLLRPRDAAGAARNRRGGCHDFVRIGRADARSSTRGCAGPASGPRGRRGGGGESVTLVREIRNTDSRPRARASCSRSAWPIKISRAHRAAAASLARTEMPPTRSVAATWATS